MTTVQFSKETSIRISDTPFTASTDGYETNHIFDSFTPSFGWETVEWQAIADEFRKTLVSQATHTISSSFFMLKGDTTYDSQFRLLIKQITSQKAGTGKEFYVLFLPYGNSGIPSEKLMDGYMFKVVATSVVDTKTAGEINKKTMDMSVQDLIDIEDPELNFA